MPIERLLTTADLVDLLEVGVEHAGEASTVLAPGQGVEALGQAADAPQGDEQADRQGEGDQGEGADDEGCALGHERIEVAHWSSAG